MQQVVFHESRFDAPSRTSNTTYVLFLNWISASTKITSPKLVARMPETLALGGSAIEVLHTRHLLYMSSYFSKTESESPNMEVLRLN